ncbi:MAG: DsbA family protein [Gemmatimonadaceae bacterium]|nr:DsbA family protein [Gemmatimonadaceae bacterium]
MSKKSLKANNGSFVAILAVVAVVGVGAIGWVMSRQGTVLTLDPATLPAVDAAGILKGNPDAPVQVIEFGDFECPGCAYYATVTGPDVMKRLVETGEVSFRFFDLPLDIHPNSVPAHNAAHCANEQGKFWEMHDRLFQGQYEWNTQATRSPKRVFERYARDLSLDVRRWNECYDSEKMLPQILANRNEANRLRVGSTPTFIIGGRMIAGAIPYDQFRAMVLEAKVQAELDKPGDGVTKVSVP